MKNRPLIPTINVQEFSYELPQERIALEPTKQRDGSRLLVYQDKSILHSNYSSIAEFLPPHAHLFFNDTKVIAARLLFKKNTGTTIEIFLLEPLDGNYEQLHTTHATSWKCLVGGSKKWKQDEALTIEINTGDYKTYLTAKRIEKAENYTAVEFTWDQSVSFSDLIKATGQIPLPPYIKRETNEEDKTRYQTVYAKEEGSVAAPTAGLHFTPTIFDSLASKGIKKSFLTLHVGAGTFKPVTAASIAEHQMHEEYFEVEKSTIAILADAKNIKVAVGTTSLRTLESLYWIGLKLMHEKSEPNLHALQLHQWDHFQWEDDEIKNTSVVFKYLYDLMEQQNVSKLIGHTGICITPGYSFKVIDALITNFHQPQSTLLLLIAAIVGEEWRNIYQNALDQGYRFLSYGDGSILFLNKH
jgi:S-adenosylmethionine:tRNA ribosyltransferase-isomerase